MEGKTQEGAAAAAGISVRSARRWKKGSYPSQRSKPHTWRTRDDPFVEVFDAEILPLLEADRHGVLEATTILAELQRRHHSLRHGPAQRAKHRVDEALQQERIKQTARDQRQLKLEALKQDFLALYALPDRSKAGLALERLLTELFELFGLKPRRPFCVVGEQIDGSFELDHDTYLLQAKWEKDPVSEEALLYFRGQIEGKSSITRGVFISINGASQPAKYAISRGKQPLFFAIDGHDLMMILSGQIALDEFLRQRRRLLGDEGLIFVPFGELFKGSRR